MRAEPGLPGAPSSLRVAACSQVSDSEDAEQVAPPVPGPAGAIAAPDDLAQDGRRGAGPWSGVARSTAAWIAQSSLLGPLVEPEPPAGRTGPGARPFRSPRRLRRPGIAPGEGGRTTPGQVTAKPR